MTDTPPETTAPDEWAIVEIMGHLLRAGRITEVARFGFVARALEERH